MTFQITALDLVRFHHITQTATSAQHMRPEYWHSTKLSARYRAALPPGKISP